MDENLYDREKEWMEKQVVVVAAYVDVAKFMQSGPVEYLIRCDLFLTQFVNSALVKSACVLTK